MPHEEESLLTNRGSSASPQQRLLVISAAASRTDSGYTKLLCRNTGQYVHTDHLLTGVRCFICITDSLHFVEITDSLSVFLFSYCRARDEKGLAVCTSLPILRAGNENSRVQPTPGVLPVTDVRIHGRSVWSQCRIHRSVSYLA